MMGEGGGRRWVEDVTAFVRGEGGFVFVSVLGRWRRGRRRR